MGIPSPSQPHGTDIAGQGVANPIAAILSAAMLLRYSLDRGPDADRVDAAVLKVLEQGHRGVEAALEGRGLGAPGGVHLDQPAGVEDRPRAAHRQRRRDQGGGRPGPVDTST